MKTKLTIIIALLLSAPIHAGGYNDKAKLVKDNPIETDKLVVGIRAMAQAYAVASEAVRESTDTRMFCLTRDELAKLTNRADEMFALTVSKNRATYVEKNTPIVIIMWDAMQQFYPCDGE